MAAGEVDALEPVDWSIYRQPEESSTTAQDSGTDNLRKMSPEDDKVYNGLYLDAEMSAMERKKLMQNLLERYWSSDGCKNPFRSALAMTLKCPDFKDGKQGTKAGRSKWSFSLTNTGIISIVLGKTSPNVLPNILLPFGSQVTVCTCSGNVTTRLVLVL
jgi:hypothetical protein